MVNQSDMQDRRKRSVRASTVGALVRSRDWIWKTLKAWGSGFWNDMAGPRGYRGIAVVIAAYIGLYSIVEARHERQMNLAAFERNMFITMVESQNASAFVAAMKNFGPVQTMSAYNEPSLFAPWDWWEKTNPNIEPLYLWAVHRLSNCTPEVCSISGTYRIDLTGADLKGAVLFKVDLSRSNLLLADLREAILIETNLEGATLLGADLRNSKLLITRLKSAEFGVPYIRSPSSANSSLRYTDLRGAEGLSCADLQVAI